MYHIPKVMHCILGKQTIQRTTYNLLSDKIAHSIVKRYIAYVPEKTFLQQLNFRNHSNNQEIYLKSQNGLYRNHCIISPTKGSKYQSTMYLHNQDLVKRCYFSSQNYILLGQSKFSQFSTIEKFWPISQNVTLNISIFQRNTDMIAITFESQIQTS